MEYIFTNMDGYNGLAEFINLNKLENDGGEIERRVPVSTMPLSALLKQYDFLQADVLALDVEGGELSVLKTINFQEACIKIISAECSPGEQCDSITDFLRPFGYAMEHRHLFDNVWVLQNSGRIRRCM
eukprot:scaffold927_cov375-Prasinococcus_capsulatus_cf.AAC.15